ncbi:MAG TPA: hypothetical protein VEL74_10800 [Thermoanaerobaculia bacterium]|nr:hypothetical protein [Thermoanaerobaculia bacterium]
MKISARSLLIAALAVCAGLTMTVPASACYQECVEVEPFCERCQDAGYLTGIACRNIGTCACKYYFPVCPDPLAAQPEPETQASLADLGISTEPEPAQCSATTE